MTASVFAWLAHSEHERQHALQLIDLFRERNTLDELGIGVVRDALADLFFPGTSTIQTRARYFLFVPWVYRQVEDERLAGDRARGRAVSLELQLINALAASPDSRGTIGIDARADLKRWPSNVYWLGLWSWGIRLFQGSQAEYHRGLDGYYRSLRTTSEAEAGYTPRPNWDPGLPPTPPGFPAGATFRVTLAEGEYLRERIMARAPKSLLAFLVDRRAPGGSTDFLWEHPLVAPTLERPGDGQQGGAGLWPHLAEQVAHARHFSEIMHGAALLYNLMLAERQNKQDLVSAYTADLLAWDARLAGRAAELTTWDRARFWEVATSGGARIAAPMRRFVERWCFLCAPYDHAARVLASGEARDVITRRELELKGGKARLHSQRALDLWSGQSFTGQLTYRWPVAQRILNDMADTFGTGEAAAVAGVGSGDA